VAACSDIAPVWSDHPVAFVLLTVGKRQYVAFYDADRRMTVASRSLGSDRWRFDLLPETVGWNSQHSISIGIDRAGLLHVSRNMHYSDAVLPVCAPA
jgi:hypothetical protein